jgi:hypothetical protein
MSNILQGTSKKFDVQHEKSPKPVWTGGGAPLVEPVRSRREAKHARLCASRGTEVVIGQMTSHAVWARDFPSDAVGFSRHQLYRHQLYRLSGSSIRACIFRQPERCRSISS